MLLYSLWSGRLNMYTFYGIIYVRIYNIYDGL